jgi:hypothetical protein
VTVSLLGVAETDARCVAVPVAVPFFCSPPDLRLAAFRNMISPRWFAALLKAANVWNMLVGRTFAAAVLIGCQIDAGVPSFVDNMLCARYIT